MGELSLHRYEIRRVLGKGGTGTVYEAYDTKNHALVALKAVEAQVAESVFRLKHEFRVLTDVQHQNLIRFGELGYEDGKWFFTMELVTGNGFLEYVRPWQGSGPRPAAPRSDSDEAAGDTVTKTVLTAWGSTVTPDRQGVAIVPPSGPTFDEVRLRSTLAQLIEALSVLHQAGRVHRDVKPGNVLVTDEGRVVLLDFGLVAALAARGGPLGDSSGTPAYMAPEQIERRQVGPAADWYAVGTMLYLALTGRLPFSGLIGMVLEEKLARSPAPAHELVANLPEDLEHLCMDLLERDPDERPSEGDIRARLGLAHHGPSAAGAGEVVPPFVGRQAERQVLDDALRAVLKGQGRAVVVEGEPGVGKTALVQHFLAELEPAKLVLAGRCYEQENVPFKGVDSIIDALSIYLLGCSEAELALLLAGGVRYLATVFPVLGRVPAIKKVVASGRSVASEVGLREEAFSELTQLMAALAAQQTLVVCLDDLQWIDGDSLALLERAFLWPSGARCLFVATLRSGAELPKALEWLRGHATRIELHGLSEAEARALWGELHAPDDARERAMREAAGHPLFLAELARAAQSGHFEPEGGALLIDVLSERIQRHDAIDRRFLEMAAVAEAPTPYAVVAHAAELEVGDCLNRLGSLKAAQLLQVTLVGGQRCIAPYHDRIREAVLAPLRSQPAGIAPLQLRLGRALLEATAAEDLPARVFTIVQHLNAAGALLTSREERLRVAELDLLASREARLATAYERARDYAHAGLTLIAELGWKGAYGHSKDLHAALMEAEAMAGQRESARAVFEASRRCMASVEDRAQLWAAWIALETGRGHFHEAITAGRAAMQELGQPIPARITQATVVLEYLKNRWAHRNLPIASLASMPPLHDVKVRAALDILVALGPSAFFVDTPLLSWLNLRVAGESMRHGVCEVSAFGFAGYGKVLAGAFGEYPRAQEFAQVALAVAERFPSAQIAAKVMVQLGAFITSWVRPYADAEAQLRMAHRMNLLLGDRAYETYAATILSVVTFCESANLSKVQETAEWSHAVGARRDNKDMAAVPEAHARYAAALRRGEIGPRDLGGPAGNDAAFRAGLDDATTPVGLFYYYFCNAELAFLTGEHTRAAELLAEAAKRVEGIFAIPTTAELWFLQALVAARRHDTAAPLEKARLLVQLVRRAQKLDACARSCPHNFEAHALIVRAELARVRGRAREAMQIYWKAALAARTHGSPKREALALELGSKHSRQRGDLVGADRLQREAALAYRRWGALGKAEMLTVRAG